MVEIDVEGVFPAPRDKLWHLLYLHQDEATIKEIHPAIISDQVQSEEGEVTYRGRTFAVTSLHERTLRSRDGIWKAAWTYFMAPPEGMRIEIVRSDGLLGAGTSWESTFAEVPDGTLISTRANLILPDVPPARRGSLAHRILDRIDEEDLRYMRRINL